MPATHHYEDKKNNCFRLGLSALGIAAVAAVLAAVFEDELLATVGAFLFLVDDTVGYIFLQCSGNAVLPCVDAQVLMLSSSTLRFCTSSITYWMGMPCRRMPEISLA